MTFPDALSDTPEQNEKTASSSAGATQDDIGVAVVFDDDDESGSDAFEIPSSSDEDSDIDSQQNLLTEGIVSAASSKNSNSLESVHAPSIDAYWLQRKFSEYFDDPTASSEKADEALEILQTPDERACENRLLLLQASSDSIWSNSMHNRKALLLHSASTQRTMMKKTKLKK